VSLVSYRQSSALSSCGWCAAERESLFRLNPSSYGRIDSFYRCAPRVAGAFMFMSQLRER
jgi:hypothetical protein